MADSIRGQIWIGGKVRQGLVRELLQVLEESGAEFDQEAEPPDGETLWGPEIDLAARTNEGGLLSLSDGSARNGAFEALERWLQDNGVPYDRHSDAFCDSEGVNVYWRPGMPAPVFCWSLQSGEDVVERSKLLEVLNMFAHGKARAAYNLLGALIDLPSPLSRLEIVPDDPPKPKRGKRKR